MTDSIPPEVLKDLPDLSAFLALNPTATAERFSRIHLTPGMLAGVAEMLAPRFRRDHGGLFLADGFSEKGFEDWSIHFGGDLEQVERMMNHRHVKALMQLGEEPSAAVENWVGETIAAFWRRSLKEQFPNLDAVIQVIDDDGEAIILVYTRR